MDKVAGAGTDTVAQGRGSAEYARGNPFSPCIPAFPFLPCQEHPFLSPYSPSYLLQIARWPRPAPVLCVLVAPAPTPTAAAAPAPARGQGRGAPQRGPVGGA